MRFVWPSLTLISFDAGTSVSFRSVTPAITVIRSRSFRLMVNVSMLWPGCYRVPAQGDVLIELPRGLSHGVPIDADFLLPNRAGSIPFTRQWSLPARMGKPPDEFSADDSYE